MRTPSGQGVRPPDVHAWLSDPRQYRRQIDRLHRRHLFTSRLYELEQNGVSLASMCWNRISLARALSRSVGRGAYEFAPARVHTIRVDGRKRLVYALRLTDSLVHGVVAALIDEAMRPLLASGLYSYRKGVSWWSAVRNCAAYLRAHRAERPDPRTRGLFAVRRDIDAYTDSIPVGARSPLWTRLRTLLGEPDRSVRDEDWRILEQVVRPEASNADGRLFTPYRGVPTGQPVSCVLFNFCLLDLDRALSSVPGAFYARYSDDILFVHPDRQVAEEASDRIDSALADLQLRANPAKRRNLYVTGAGRRIADDREWSNATAIPFLGWRIAFTGEVSLSGRKTRRLLSDLERRATRTASRYANLSEGELGSLVCAVLNRALDFRTDPFQQRSASLLRRAVTDRHHLRQLDHSIARIVLRAVSGDGSVKAFRRIPYRTIRQEWKLMSLVHARNRWPGG